MSDPGLSHRLRQRSRRAGFMIGVSMILTIALCAIGFTLLYTALDGFTSDFISRTDETPTVVAQSAQQPGSEQTGDAPNRTTQQATRPPQAEVQQQQQDDPQPTATEANATDDEEGFSPDFQIESNVTINLRAGPSTATSILDGLPPATPLEYLEEDAPTDDPADGERWMRFETEDGLIGWVREIDVTEYEP